MQKNTSLGCTKVLTRLDTAITTLFIVKERLLIYLNDMHSTNVHFSIALHTIKKALFSECEQENI